MLLPSLLQGHLWWNGLRLLFTLQAIIGSVIFFRLSRYNKNHEKKLETARLCIGKPSSSLFELPAFRGKTIPAPFENTTWLLSFYEQVKVSFVSVTLFPLRFICVVWAFLGAFVLVTIFQKLGMKTIARSVITICGRIILFGFGFYRITIKGNLEPGAGVLVSNHCTFLDGLVWVVVSTPRIFAEASNFKNPIMNAFADALDIVLFDRSGAESRKEARQLMESSAKEAHEGKKSPILVFPTGTTTNLNVVITFKVGAFSAGVPVQPALLRYKFRHCDPAWVFSGPGTLMLIFRLMCQFYNKLEIEFLPVHHPTEEEKEEPSKFARHVQIKVAEAMKVPVTEHSVEDLQLQFAAVKANLPAEVGVVGFTALKEVFEVDANQIKQQLNVFKEMDPKGTGLIGFEEFKDCFRRGFHEPSAEQTQLLQLTGGSTHLDFRKFLIGLALVNENEKALDSSPGNKSTVLPIAEVQDKIYAQLAFAAFATEANDRISWNEFTELWSFLHPSGIDAALLDALGVAAPAGRGARELFARTFGMTSTSRSTLPSDASESNDSLEKSSEARKVFEHIAGSNAEELTWAQFAVYAEKTPVFVKHLRQSFFNRIATDLSQQA
jgi:lysophosphatidylcholine acyltransferase/lyso-PAF acetyltransferase